MKLRLSKKERDTFHKIHLLSGKSYEDVRDVYEGFLYSIVLAYLEKEPIYFPYFGEINIQFIKDKLTRQGKEAELEISIQPSDILKRVIGQIEDGDETDLETILKERIEKILIDVLEEED